MNQDTSGLYKTMATLSNALALAAALLGTPVLFDATRSVFFLYFHRVWGRAMAELLLWVAAVIEAYVIYACVSFLLMAGLVWITTTVAQRRFEQ